MAIINPIQPSFSGGEFSSSIFPRVDIQKYSTGLKTCRNFIVHPSGGASNRPGTRFVAEARDDLTLNTAVIVQEFIFSDTQKYIFELGNKYIRFYTSGAQIEVDPDTDSINEWATGTSYSIDDYVTYIPSTTTVSSTYLAILAGTGFPPETYPSYWSQQDAYEIASPYDDGDLNDLRFESSADVTYITHPEYQTRTLSRYGNTDWRLELYAPDNGPFMLENIDESVSLNVSAVTGSVSLTASSSEFAAGHVGSFWKLRHPIEGQTDSGSYSGAATGTGITCFRTWRVISHGTWTGNFNIEKSIDSGVTWTVLRNFSSVNDFNANTSGTEDTLLNEIPFLVRINAVAISSGTANIDLSTDPFNQEGVIELTAVHTSISATGTVVTDFGSTDQTTTWAEGSWSDYRGWPGVARFYQDRLCFASTPAEPMTTWMTETGVYTSYLRHSPLLDTDAITVRLPSRKLNAINGMIALKKLIVFTSSSEWTIGSEGGASALSALTVEQKLEGYRGSSGVNPTAVGNEAIYMQSNGKVVRSLGYNFGEDSFMGSELNILSKHMFKDWDIIDLAYQQDPDSIVWALRDDGKLLAMTYMREQEVVAWTRHDTGSDE